MLPSTPHLHLPDVIFRAIDLTAPLTRVHSYWSRKGRTATWYIISMASRTSKHASHIDRGDPPTILQLHRDFDVAILDLDILRRYFSRYAIRTIRLYIIRAVAYTLLW